MNLGRPGRYIADYLNTSSAGKDCQGLTKRSLATTEATCAASCCADQKCTVYQFCDAGETW